MEIFVEHESLWREIICGKFKEMEGFRLEEGQGIDLG